MTSQERREFLRRWLRTAREDLEGAVCDLGDPDRPARHACLWAHLAAEKALKAVLISLQVDFPKTHDLERLLTLIPPDWTIRSLAPDLEALSDLAIDSRYPGDLPEVAHGDAERAVAAAKVILDTVVADLVARDPLLMG